MEKNSKLPINTLSASALQAWIDCPRKFRLTRIDRVEPSFRPVALAFGSGWHEALGFILFAHGRGEAVTRDEQRQRFRDALARQIRADGPPVLYEDDEDEGRLADIGVEMLDAFLDGVPLPERVLGIEVPFDVELYDPETGEVLEVPLIGSLDAVVEERGRTVVLEFKSGKRRWSDEKIGHDLQATTYRIGAKSRGISDPEQRLVVTTKSATRPQVQIERLVRTDADELEVMDTAVNVVRAIESGVDHRVRSWRCASCPVAGACR